MEQQYALQQSKNEPFKIVMLGDGILKHSSYILYNPTFNRTRRENLLNPSIHTRQV